MSPDPHGSDGRPSSREVSWLRHLRELSDRMAGEWDVDRLLPLILDAAIELTRAARGYLVLVRGRHPRGGPALEVVQARGFDRTTLRGPEGKVSRTVVERVVEGSGDGLVTTRERDVLAVSSVQARQVAAIACVPLRYRGVTRGVLYLDHQEDPAAFSAGDLPLLQTFADQAGLALGTAELLAEQARQARELEAARASLRAAREAIEAHEAPREPAARAGLGRLVGRSPAMRALYEDVEQVAAARGPVLLLGEPGVGKEAVARELHARGPAPEAPFSVLACSREDLQAELLGAEGRGGALARPGSVLLDELADLPPPLQARLHRALSAGEARARLIATTHRDPEPLVRSGQLRADLYYRLDVLRIVVPPLRERREDVPLLLEHFARQAGRRLELTPGALERLMAYAWPGNVGELEGEAMRLILGHGQGAVGARDLSARVREGRGVSSAPGGQTLEDVERAMVERALAESGGNKARAARQLGIPRSTLYGLLVRYGLGP